MWARPMSLPLVCRPACFPFHLCYPRTVSVIVQLHVNSVILNVLFCKCLFSSNIICCFSSMLTSVLSRSLQPGWFPFPVGLCRYVWVSGCHYDEEPPMALKGPGPGIPACQQGTQQPGCLQPQGGVSMGLFVGQGAAPHGRRGLLVDGYLVSPRALSCPGHPWCSCLGRGAAGSEPSANLPHPSPGPLW